MVEHTTSLWHLEVKSIDGLDGLGYEFRLVVKSTSAEYRRTYRLKEIIETNQVLIVCENLFLRVVLPTAPTVYTREASATITWLIGHNNKCLVEFTLPRYRQTPADSPDLFLRIDILEEKNRQLSAEVSELSKRLANLNERDGHVCHCPPVRKPFSTFNTFGSSSSPSPFFGMPGPQSFGHSATHTSPSALSEGFQNTILGRLDIPNGHDGEVYRTLE